MPRVAPSGDLQTYTRERFATDAYAFDIYRKGVGPAVLVLTEMPGISPQVLGFADRIVQLGCTAVLPDLFGKIGRDPARATPWQRNLYYLQTVASVCVRREFNILVSGRASPVTAFLRKLAAHEHARCGGPGVGVIGMCFTGGFALALAADPCVLAPVLSQPSMPYVFAGRNKRGVDCSEEQLGRVRDRCAKDGISVLGLRFHGDPLVPRERFQYLREQLGDAFVAVELDQGSGHPDNPLPQHHSVLTLSLIDEPGQPTHDALQTVLQLFRERLLLGKE